MLPSTPTTTLSVPTAASHPLPPLPYRHLLPPPRFPCSCSHSLCPRRRSTLCVLLPQPLSPSSQPRSPFHCQPSPLGHSDPSRTPYRPLGLPSDSPLSLARRLADSPLPPLLSLTRAVLAVSDPRPLISLSLIVSPPRTASSPTSPLRVPCQLLEPPSNPTSPSPCHIAASDLPPHSPLPCTHCVGPSDPPRTSLLPCLPTRHHCRRLSSPLPCVHRVGPQTHPLPLPHRLTTLDPLLSSFSLACAVSATQTSLLAPRTIPLPSVGASPTPPHPTVSFTTWALWTPLGPPLFLSCIIWDPRTPSHPPPSQSPPQTPSSASFPSPACSGPLGPRLDPLPSSPLRSGPLGHHPGTSSPSPHSPFGPRSDPSLPRPHALGPSGPPLGPARHPVTICTLSTLRAPPPPLSLPLTTARPRCYDPDTFSLLSSS